MEIILKNKTKKVEKKLLFCQAGKFSPHPRKYTYVFNMDKPIPVGKLSAVELPAYFPCNARQLYPYISTL